MIEARLLTKVFRDKKRGEIRGADGVSFRVEPGRIYGLLGANGAGKTTTLRMLATLLKPTSGTADRRGLRRRRASRTRSARTSVSSRRARPSTTGSRPAR